jgi:diamine N-acetyltransferase
MRTDDINGRISPWGDVFLTPLIESDSDLLYEWQNSPKIRDSTMGFRFPVQKNTVKDWIKKVEEQNSKSQVVYAIRLKTDFVGIVSLHQIQQYQRKSLLGIYLGDSAHHGKGIGFVAMCLILDFAFNGLDFRKVSLEVVESNQSAINLYKRIGFINEGLKREEYFVGGKYLNTQLFGILNHEFKIDIPDDANRLVLMNNER